MQTFIAQQNLKLYQQKLGEAVNPDDRERLQILVDAERERLRQLTEVSPPDAA